MTSLSKVIIIALVLVFIAHSFTKEYELEAKDITIQYMDEIPKENFSISRVSYLLA